MRQKEDLLSHVATRARKLSLLVQWERREKGKKKKKKEERKEIEKNRVSLKGMSALWMHLATRTRPWQSCCVILAAWTVVCRWRGKDHCSAGFLPLFLSLLFTLSFSVCFSSLSFLHAFLNFSSSYFLFFSLQIYCKYMSQIVCVCTYTHTCIYIYYCVHEHLHVRVWSLACV